MWKIFPRDCPCIIILVSWTGLLGNYIVDYKERKNCTPLKKNSKCHLIFFEVIKKSNWNFQIIPHKNLKHENKMFIDQLFTFSIIRPTFLKSEHVRLPSMSDIFWVFQINRDGIWSDPYWGRWITSIRKNLLKKSYVVRALSKRHWICSIPDLPLIQVKGWPWKPRSLSP